MSLRLLIVKFFSCATLMIAAASGLVGWTQQPTPPQPSQPQPAQPPAPQRPANQSPTPAEIDQWIVELNSDSFAIREHSMLRLIEAGTAGTDRVAAAVAKGPLEVVVRGIHVLREQALTSDVELGAAAQAALERIASNQSNSAARRAESAIATLDETREERAVDELQQLGAKVGVHHMQFGFQIVESASIIEIGPEWSGQPKDLARLKWLSKVHEVKFSGPKVTDEWLACLKSMRHLVRLQVTRANVTADGFASIRDHEKLQSVWIKYSPVSDAVIPHLLTLKQVSQIKLYGTNVSRESVKRLSDELVNAKIDHRRGGFLGVNCQAHPLGCEVVLVQNNTAASAAGLDAGDIIVKYGSNRVESFDTLTTFIAENLPGDKVELLIASGVRVRRGSFEHRKDLPLGAEFKSHVLGCEVVSVAPSSVAFQLGLKPGDVITAYRETRTLEPNVLRDEFKKGAEAEEGSFDYIRAPQISVKVVTLGEWD